MRPRDRDHWLGVSEMGMNNNYGSPSVLTYSGGISLKGVRLKDTWRVPDGCPVEGQHLCSEGPSL